MELTLQDGEKLRTIFFESGALLSDVLQLHHLPLDFPCAGKGRCCQCRVKVSGKLSAPTPTELEALSDTELKQGVRLACLTVLEGDVHAELLPYATLENIVVSGILPTVEHHPLTQNYGMAVDIGTTTVAAQLYRLNDCTLLRSASVKNPQSYFGADVISRMEQALSGKSDTLFYSISAALNRIVRDFAMQEQLDPTQIDSMVITGNTAMLYLFTRQNPDCLCHAPFEADCLFGEYRSGKELGIVCSPHAAVYLPRCISAFIGADITTAILASGLQKQAGTVLLADIGTNGEIVLQHNGKLFCCSTAAGPAFEGAGLHMGLNGVAGAIDTVAFADGQISCTTIRNKSAVGICGSGIIDALAVLLKAGILDESGLLLEEGHSFTASLRKQNNNPAFLIDGKHVLITQKDIRMVQLAKSAICAGMLTLMEQAEISVADINKVYLAGGFGSFLNLQNAAYIGLIPPALAPKTIVIGNAAQSGAAMLLQNSALSVQASNLAMQAVTIDLTSSPLFLEHYMDCMGFGEL